MEPLWNLPQHPAALEDIGGTVVEPSSGARRAGAWWKPGGTLVEPYLKPPQTTPQPLQNLVEPWWKPRRWWNPGGTLVEPWWNPGGTLVEPWWNLSSGSPQTTPEPIWAETPKLSAAGEKEEQKRMLSNIAWKADFSHFSLQAEYSSCSTQDGKSEITIESNDLGQCHQLAVPLRPVPLGRNAGNRGLATARANLKASAREGCLTAKEQGPKSTYDV